ncbi:MAG TPA: transporter substrate-binding domain-containing protein [Nitrospinota bacterium]|nr:transporter substrate-binding domain-containing protein [Nitrospinota bacterium]
MQEMKSSKNLFLFLFWTILFLFILPGLAHSEKGLEKNTLTSKEREWLDKNDGNIVLAPESNYPPFIFVDKKDGMKGISVDYIKLIEQKLGFKFQIASSYQLAVNLQKAQEGTVDVLTSLKKTPVRSEYLLFTKSYIEIPAVIVVRKEEKSSLALEKMNGMKIAVGDGYGVHTYIQNEFKNLDLLPVPDDLIGLRMLSFGEVDAVVLDVATASYFIEKEGIGNLRVAGNAEYIYNLSMASRKDLPILHRILEKGLAQITEEEKRAIFSKWIRLESVSFMDNKKFWYWVLTAISVIVFIFSFIIVWNRALKSQVKQRTEELNKELAERRRVEESLKKAHDELDERVKDRTVELAKANEKIQLEHSKLMGILNSMEDGVYIANKNYDIEYINSVIEREFGAINKRKCFEYFHDRTEKCPWCKNKEVFAGKTVNWEWYSFKNQKTYDLFDTPYRNSDGSISKLEIFHDITGRKKADDLIQSALKEKEVLLREIHHRVKNNMQVISSLLNLQSKYVKNKENIEMFKESQNRIKSMSLVHEKLYESKDMASVNFKDYIQNLTNDMFRIYNVDINKVTLQTSIEVINLGIDTAIPCGLVINELLSNCFKHAFPKGKKGKIDVIMQSVNMDEYELIVSDNGVSVPDKLNVGNSKTFGLKLITDLVENQLEGTLDLNRDNGTEFRIRFKEMKYKKRT